MRVEPNLMLRGSTWSLRIAVPKALRELQVQAGKEPGQKEIWRSLGTADQRAARLQAIEAKAALLREFDTAITTITTCCSGCCKASTRVGFPGRTPVRGNGAN